MEGGWHAHPDAAGRAAPLPPVDPGRVVGLGAVCDLRSGRPGDVPYQSFAVSEFVRLDDGRRVTLHEDRGFTMGGRSSAGPAPDPVRGETRESVTRNVLNVVLPDDDGAAEEHPWSWLAGLARARGLDVTAQDLRRLPYEVVLTDAVDRWLASS